MSATDPTANSLTDALVLDGQRSPTPARGWCERGPDHLRLATPEGFFRPRCKRRDCPRCWAVRSRELARCLLIDARAELPAVCVTLTTRDPDTSPATYRQGSKSLFRRLRRRYGRVEYFGASSSRPGARGPQAGGGGCTATISPRACPPKEAPAIEGLVRETRQAITGAWRVEVGALRSPGAALGYLGLHHRKAEQAPPAEWRGMTERASQRYWHRPIAELSALARAELAVEAHAHRTGLPLELAALEVAAREPGRLIEVGRLRDGPLLEPLGEFSGRLPDETREAIAAARRRWR